MAAPNKRETIWVDSSDGHTRLHGYVWWPDEGRDVRAIVQLVHGMSEHIGRYDEFARYLTAKGFVVCGHDHVGHGESVASKDEWGCLPADGGVDILVNDVHRVRTYASSLVTERKGVEHPPYFVFGHSMGSFVVSSYIARYAFGLSGAVICGTGFMPPRTCAAGNRLARTIARVRGQDYHSKILHNIGVGAYAQDIDDAETEYDWLSHNRDNVQSYIDDEACGFMFSAGGYVTLTALMREVCSPECAQLYPKDLPLLYIAGTEDPVGECGEGVSAAADLAHKAGVRDVRCRLYAGMRHEILMERGKRLVFDDVANWMEDHLS